MLPYISNRISAQIKVGKVEWGSSFRRFMVANRNDLHQIESNETKRHWQNASQYVRRPINTRIENENQSV